MEPTEHPELTTLETQELEVAYRIEFKRHFYAAHRLAPPYEGKCSNIHGHNYQVAVLIGSQELNSAGVVVEFDSVKQVVDVFDHAMILWEKDPLYGKLYELGMALVPVPVNPTTEALSKYLAETILVNCLEENPSIAWVGVHLWETEHIHSDGFALASNFKDLFTE